MTFEKFVADNPEVPAAELAKTIVETQAALAINAVKMRIEHLRRSGVLQIERSDVDNILGAIERGRVRSKASGTPTVSLAALRETFALGDGNIVQWGVATVDQHLLRASLLQKHADGVLQTAERHRRAAEIIKSRKVACLNDLVKNKKAARALAKEIGVPAHP